MWSFRLKVDCSLSIYMPYNKVTAEKGYGASKTSFHTNIEVLYPVSVRVSSDILYKYPWWPRASLLTWWEVGGDHRSRSRSVRRGRRDIMISQTLAPAQLSDDLRPGILLRLKFWHGSRILFELRICPHIWSPLDWGPNILWSHRPSETFERQQQISMTLEWYEKRKVFCLWDDFVNVTTKTNLHSG